MSSKTQILIFLFLVHVSPAFSQVSINYGSNNGKYITLKNTRIYYEEYGKGVPLLLLHGGLGSINDFRKVIPELAKHYRVIAADSPGHGRSEQSPTLSYELFSAYFSSMIDKLELDSVYLLGWSDGGNAALILAATRPDKVKKVVISGADMDTDGYDPNILARIGTLTPDYVEANMKEWLTQYRSNSPQKDNWRKFIEDSRKMWLTKIVITEEKVKRIKMPVLIMLGDRDVVLPEHGLRMRRLIKGSQLAILPGTGHAVFDAKPDLVLSLVLLFFKGT